MAVNTTGRIWRTVVNTSCSDDKMFPGGATYMVLTCAEKGEWRPASVDCVGTRSIRVFLVGKISNEKWKQALH